VTSPQGKLRDCKRIVIVNRTQYTVLLQELAERKREELIVLFGVLGPDCVEVLEAETLPSECYKRKKKNSVKIRVAEFKQHCEEREAELNLEYKAQLNDKYKKVELIGVDHIHRDFGPKSVEASKGDKKRLPILGLGLFYLIHHTTNLDPCSVRVYAPHSEEFLIKGSKKFTPDLVELQKINTHCLYTT